MPNFAKIWTTIFDDEWFVGLSGIERGIFLQLIILMKRGSDQGQICTRSVQQLSDKCAVNRRTMDRMLAKIQTKCPQSVRRLSNGTMVVALPNYKKYQELRAMKDNIPPNIEQSRLDQSRADKKRPDQNLSGKTAQGLDPYEIQRREDLEGVVKIISAWPCMKGVKNPYGIAGKLFNIYKKDAVFTCEVLRQKSDIFCLCKDASHLIASATATYQRASDIPEIESRAHKQDDGTKRGQTRSIREIMED